MDTLSFTPTHKKGQHLTREERYYISIRLNIDHWSIYKIAKELHRPYNTINKEVQCGTVYLYNGKVKRYKPAYCRVSTNNDAQIESLETQKSKYQKQLQQNIASVIKDSTAITTDGIDEKLMELQQELVRRRLTLYID